MESWPTRTLSQFLRVPSCQGLQTAITASSSYPPKEKVCEDTTVTKIPDACLDLLLEEKAFAHLATVMPDGSPQNTPVWFDYATARSA
jgi:hypothetical protein